MLGTSFGRCTNTKSLVCYRVSQRIGTSAPPPLCTGVVKSERIGLHSFEAFSCEPNLRILVNLQTGSVCLRSMLSLHFVKMGGKERSLEAGSRFCRHSVDCQTNCLYMLNSEAWQTSESSQTTIPRYTTMIHYAVSHDAKK